MPLSARVRCEPPFADTVARWLDGVYAADDLQPWLVERDRLPAHSCLINAAGQRLSRDGFVHYVGDTRTHGVIEREREIAALDDALQTLAQAQQTAHERAAACEARVAQWQGRLTELRTEQQARQGAVHSAQVALLQLTQARDRAAEQQARIADDLQELARGEAQEREHLDAATAELERCETLLDVLRARAEHASEVRSEREASWRESQEQLQALTREVQEANFSRRVCVGKLDDIARNMALAEEQRTRLQQEHDNRTAEHAAADPAAGAAALQAALTEHASREAALSARRETLEHAVLALKAVEEQRLRVEQSAAPLRDTVAELRLARQAAELAEAQHQERMDEVEADEVALAPKLDGVNEAALQREVATLGRQIAALGAVNLAALDELASAQQRKGYLDDQHADLTQAIHTLEDAIRRIDRETREQLQATYDTVNVQFSTLFPQLFGGGQASLVLTGDEILDAGIQIVAQPPGKKNASIHLLSGGEKALTAIALVFALFALNPAPFCMLDEVDAPLDDTNTGRFCEMVKRMAMQTQFLFISHNKITMEIAHQLVGVTMQEQGVSRVVEVDMDEALRMADAATA